MFTYRGKTALITGASAGIGAVFARMLAQRGTTLVLVARSEEKLRKLAAELAEQHGIQAEVIAADLTRDGAAQRVYQETQQRGLSVDILINNAGFGTHGHFDELSLERQRDEVTLNVTALIELTHLFLPAMLQQGSGAVVNVASTAGFQPLPYMAIYGATKAFVISFSQALWSEYRRRGVRVLALCPGATETSFFDVVGTRQPAVGLMSTPEHVVQVGLRALEGSKSLVIPGWLNNVGAFASRILPRSWIVGLVHRMYNPGQSKAGAAEKKQGTGRG